MSASTKALALIAALSLIASAARSDGIGNTGVLGQGTFGGIGGAISVSSGPPPSGCQGAVDASAGCPLPMIGI